MTLLVVLVLLVIVLLLVRLVLLLIIMFMTRTPRSSCLCPCPCPQVKAEGLLARRSVSYGGVLDNRHPNTFPDLDLPPPHDADTAPTDKRRYGRAQDEGVGYNQSEQARGHSGQHSKRHELGNHHAVCLITFDACLPARIQSVE